MEAFQQEIETEIAHGSKRRTNRLKADGSYDKKPLDPDYFKKYYMNKMACPSQCDICGKEMTISSINRHKKTNMCQVFAYFKNNKPLDEASAISI